MTPIEPRLDLSILVDRLQRLVKLDTSVFEEVRLDPSATVPAFFVAASSTFLAGIGGWLWWVTNELEDGGRVFLLSAIVGSFVSLAFWIIWMAISWLILTQLFKEEADWQQMLRTMGMAAAPQAIAVGMFIPGIDLGIALASIALFFGLTTIAIQAVTQASPARVLVANLGGFAFWATVLGLLATSESPLAPGIFLFNAAG